MEKIKEQYEVVVSALATLQESLVAIEDTTLQSVRNFIRDSVIQRFEYSIDTFWKYLKVLLQEEHKVDLEMVSPRLVLRESLQAGLLTNQEFIVLSKSVIERNLTSHTYNEKFAEEIISRIPQYYTVMNQVIKRVDPKINS